MNQQEVVETELTTQLNDMDSAAESAESAPLSYQQEAQPQQEEMPNGRILDRAKFFDAIRPLFGGRMESRQVEGVEAILNFWDSPPDAEPGKVKARFFEVMSRKNDEWLAYVLATAHHETARTMAPIDEMGSWQYLAKYDTGRLAKALGNTPEADGDGQKFKGRGHVMITGRRNYDLFTQICRAFHSDCPDLTEQPEAVKRMELSVLILIYGMLCGAFTGRKLEDYVDGGESPRKVDFINARRTVNGMDKAEKIASNAMKFLEALENSSVPAASV